MNTGILNMFKKIGKIYLFLIIISFSSFVKNVLCMPSLSFKHMNELILNENGLIEKYTLIRDGRNQKNMVLSPCQSPII